MPRAPWIVFEGGDGVGKSTQVERLAARLATEGIPHVVTREPGGTPLGAELRTMLQHGEDVSPRAEALLFAADRAHHVASVVLPAVESGQVVVQDRFIDSSVVYQGLGRGLGEDTIRDLSTWATDGVLPDLTIVLDRSTPLRRVDGNDRLERDMEAKQEQIRDAFRRLAASSPNRYAIVDADAIEDVAEQVWLACAPLVQPVAAA